MEELFKYTKDNRGRETSPGEILVITVLFLVFISIQKYLFMFISRTSGDGSPELSLSWIYLFLIAAISYAGFLVFLFIKYKHPRQVKKYFIWGFKASFSAVLGGCVVFYILLVPGKYFGLALSKILGLIIKDYPAWLNYAGMMLLPFFGAGVWAGRKMKIDGYTWGIVTSSFIIFMLVLSDHPDKLITGIFYDLGAGIYILLSVFSAIGSKIMTRPLEQEIKREKEEDNKESDNISKKVNRKGKKKSRFTKNK